MYDKENKRKYRQRARLLALEFVELVKAHPCKDCDGQFPTCAMDFDHVRGEKTYCVGRMMSGAHSVKRIAKEIAKCELVCSNCHRVRTQDRIRCAG